MGNHPSRWSLSKTLYQKMMLLPVLPEFLAGFTHSEATILMTHRFCVPNVDVPGHDADNLRKVLAQLRRRRYELISIAELFRRLRDGAPLERAVAFTVDDGYYDVGQIAAPIFAEFDCPATVFAVTDFLDGKMWLWWDKIAFLFTESKHSEIVTHLGKERLRYSLERSGRESWRDLVNRCHSASPDERLACIAELSASAEVELPSRVPARYRSLSWDEARALESKGIDFGPHTLTHPILSSILAEDSEREITGSWQRLREELSRPVPIFCYPGGEHSHFGDREIQTMARAGLWGAVTGQAGNIRAQVFQGSYDRWYRVPRCMYRDTLPSVLACVSGMEKLKAQLRGDVTN